MLKKLNKFPPVILRLMARHRKRGLGAKAMTDLEISERSKIPLDRIIQIEEMTDWSDVKVHEIEQFIHGCGLRHLESTKVARNEKSIFKRSTYPYLWKDPKTIPHFTRLLSIATAWMEGHGAEYGWTYVKQARRTKSNVNRTDSA